MTDQPTDQELVGKAGPTDQLTDAERTRLTGYWRRTHDFARRGEELLAPFLDTPPAQQPDGDPAALRGLLVEWRALWQQLRDWQYTVNHARSGDPDTNPVARRLVHDDTTISGLSQQLRERER